MNYMLRSELLGVLRLVRDSDNINVEDVNILLNNFKSTLDRKKDTLEYELKQVEDSLATLEFVKEQIKDLNR